MYLPLQKNISHKLPRIWTIMTFFNIKSSLYSPHNCLSSSPNIPENSVAITESQLTLRCLGQNPIMLCKLTIARFCVAKMFSYKRNLVTALFSSCLSSFFFSTAHSIYSTCSNEHLLTVPLGILLKFTSPVLYTIYIVLVFWVLVWVFCLFGVF